MTPASLRRRLAAFGVDYIFISLYIVLLTLVAVFAPALTRVFRTPGLAHGASFLVLTLPVMLYFALWEASRHAATPGKRSVGIVVVGVNGERLGVLRSLARTALKFVPWELAHTCLWRIPGWPQPDGPLPPWIVAGLVAVWVLVGLNVLLAWRSPGGQAAYDLAAGAMVVRTERDRAARM